MTQDIDMSMDPEDIVKEAHISIASARKNKNDPHLYVINTSDFDGTEQRGEVSLKYRTEDGENVRYKIPDSWIPRDLSIYQPKDKWLRDLNLNRLVEGGYLTIVDTTIAEQILESSEARAETKRIQESYRKLAPHDEANRLATNRQTAAARDKFKAINEVKQINVMETDDNARITPRIMTIMKNTETDEQQKLASLKNFRAHVTAGDIDYIMKNCGREYPRIKQWAIEQRQR